MKNKNRMPILLRMISKSDQMMDDLVSLTMKISAQPKLYMHLDEATLFAPHNSESNTKDIEDYRNTLIEQMKESDLKNLHAR